MANKPSFTLMDYKQRVIDSLSKLKGSKYAYIWGVRKKMSQDSQKEEQ